MPNEEEEEGDVIDDIGEDATFDRLAHMTEAMAGENSPVGGSDYEWV